MKKQIIEFRCDFCEKEIVCENEFPYKKGWLYIYKLNLKYGDEGKIQELNDKHFCSAKCFFSFMNKALEAMQLEQKSKGK